MTAAKHRKRKHHKLDNSTEFVQQHVVPESSHLLPSSSFFQF